MKLEDIKQRIDETIDRIEKDLLVINSLTTNCREQLKDKYINTLDLSLTLQEQRRLEEQNRQLAMLFSGEEQQNNEVREIEEQRKENKSDNSNNKRGKVTFEVIDILDNIYKLREFMKVNGINYRRIV